MSIDIRQPLGFRLKRVIFRKDTQKMNTCDLFEGCGRCEQKHDNSVAVDCSVVVSGYPNSSGALNMKVSCTV